MTANGDRVPFCGDEDILESDSGDGLYNSGNILKNPELYP